MSARLVPCEPGWESSLAGRLAAGAEGALLAPLRYLGDGRSPDGVAPAAPSSREELGRALAEANAGYGHPRAAELARRLADPATRVVVTGQQPGLFGGPLMTLYKMLAAARWAERLGGDEPAVALFWMATEDHDYTEVSEAVIPGQEGLRRLSLGDDPAPLAPVGMRSLGEAVDSLFDEWSEEATGERYEEWLGVVRRLYRPAARFGEAFARLMLELLGERAPLLVDSMHPAVKRLEAPWLRRLVERRRQVSEALARGDAAVEERGFPLQVRPQPNASPLFLLADEERRRIEWREAGGYALRSRDDGARPIDELLAALDDNPSVVSPGVLARPPVQDGVLGTTLQVVGPGELAYLAQAAPLYEVLEVAAPTVVLRPRALVLETHQLDWLGELELDLEELATGAVDLDRHLARRAGAPGIEGEEAAQQLKPMLDRLRRRALALDPNLERPWEKTRDQIHKALDTFAGKVTRAAAGRNEVEARRAQSLLDACRPLGRPQERVISTAHFPGKYGRRFVDTLWEELELAAAGIQVVVAGGEE